MNMVDVLLGALALGLPHTGTFESGMEFDAVFLRARPGSSLQVRFLRGGTPQTATVRIGEKP